MRRFYFSFSIQFCVLFFLPVSGTEQIKIRTNIILYIRFNTILLLYFKKYLYMCMYGCMGMFVCLCIYTYKVIFNSYPEINCWYFYHLFFCSKKNSTHTVLKTSKPSSCGGINSYIIKFLYSVYECSKKFNFFLHTHINSVCE